MLPQREIHAAALVLHVLLGLSALWRGWVGTSGALREEAAGGRGRHVGRLLSDQPLQCI